MANQDLEIWSSELAQDDIAGNQQRRTITEEEWLEGWKRLFGVSNQQLNQLFYLLSSYAAPIDTAPYLHYTSGTSIPDVALEMNGQSINSTDTPELFNYYGSTLPDLTTEAPTNFTYLVRKH